MCLNKTFTHTVKVKYTNMALKKANKRNNSNLNIYTNPYIHIYIYTQQHPKHLSFGNNQQLQVQQAFRIRTSKRKYNICRNNNRRPCQTR